LGSSERKSTDERLDRLAPLLVGHADDRHFVDRRMRADNLLDLAGIDVGAAGDDHVLLAVGDGRPSRVKPHGTDADGSPVMFFFAMAHARSVAVIQHSSSRMASPQAGTNR